MVVRAMLVIGVGWDYGADQSWDNADIQRARFVSQCDRDLNRLDHYLAVSN